MDEQEVPGDLGGAGLTVAAAGAGGEHLLDESDLAVSRGLERTQVTRLEALEPASGARHDEANMATIDR